MSSRRPLAQIRQAKRYADQRYGNLSRLFQFCAVGASGMVVDLSIYTLARAALRPPLGAGSLTGPGASGSWGGVTRADAWSAFLGIAVAVTWNFAINRRLTFNDARRGSIARQYRRYVLSNLAGCGVSFAFRLGLPASTVFFAQHRLLAALTGIVAATGISFTMARWFVFGARPLPARSASTSGTPDLDTRLDDAQGRVPAMHHRSATRAADGQPAPPRLPVCEENRTDLVRTGKVFQKLNFFSRRR